MTTRIVHPCDPEWPDGLRDQPLGVERLFLRGAELPPKDLAVAVVGTRRPTAAGIEAARTLTKGLVQAGFAIVSGLAMGIDAIAHRAALEQRGHTVAVLGCGVDLVYPKKNEALKKMIEVRGTIVSEYEDGTESAPWRFPERNRIIAGLSAAVVVIEGSFRSGALITARHASDLGRSVFAVPGSTRNPMAAAPNELIRTSIATLITDVKHITDDLAPALVYAKADEKASGPVALDPAERTVLALLDDVAVTTDFVCSETAMSVGEAAVSLSRLEVRGFVRRSPRGYEITDAGGRVRAALSSEEALV